MKDVLKLILIAILAMVSVARSCTKTVKVADNINPAYVKSVHKTDDATTSTKAVKVIGKAKKAADAYKFIGNARNDSIKTPKPK